METQFGLFAHSRERLELTICLSAAQMPQPGWSEEWQKSRVRCGNSEQGGEYPAENQRLVL